VLTVVWNNERFLSFSTFITKAAFSQRSGYICHYVHISLVFPNHCSKVTSHPSTYATLFQ
jgi:hypothetical protein